MEKIHTVSFILVVYNRRAEPRAHNERRNIAREYKKRLPKDIVRVIGTFEAYRISNTENRKDSNHDQKE